MILFPAIDLKDGRCVRLKRGLMDQATVFNDDPAAQARQFRAAGFRWLHCVDLNGAFDGRSVNADAIRAIRAAIDLPIQLGGGIRDMAAVEAWLAAGITRVILGTAALKNPAFVREAARAHPGRIVVGADAKGGKVATEGWAEVSDLTPADLGRMFEDAGVAAILFTDIDGDGLPGRQCRGDRRPGAGGPDPGDRVGRRGKSGGYRAPVGGPGAEYRGRGDRAGAL